MSHTFHRIERFEIVGPYILAVGFDDGTEQRIDFRPVLEGELFGPLQNPTVFNAVTLDKEVGTLTWGTMTPGDGSGHRESRLVHS